MPTRNAVLLAPTEVADYLRGRRLVPSDAPVDVETIGGGVSNATFAVRAGGTHLVVKQALPRLRVADTWEADPARAGREGLALQTLHQLTPDAVPPCLHIDVERHLIVLPHAPLDWTDWKSQLLSGTADERIAARLGRLLATWHVATDGGVPQPLRDRIAFEQLRVEPYYETVMARRPDLRATIQPHLDRMLSRPRCLVDGDFSPKNVLVGPDGLWVIDLEVAHLGDPAFDVAFLLSHLALKAVRLPSCTNDYRRCAEAFVTEYASVAGPDRAPMVHVLGTVGCLLLARVLGKSPVEYLDPTQQAQAVAVGELLVREPPADLVPLWPDGGRV